MASITLHSIGQLQGSSNKMHNQVRTGVKSHKTISSETGQSKTSQTMVVTLIMKTKGSRLVRTTTNRMDTRTDKIDPTAALHTGFTGMKLVFTINR